MVLKFKNMMSLNKHDKNNQNRVHEWFTIQDLGCIYGEYIERENETSKQQGWRRSTCLSP